MQVLGTLKLDSGDDIRVAIDSDDLEHPEFVVRPIASDSQSKLADHLAVIDRHLATAKRHSAGTTDRLLQADRNRPY